MNMADAYARVSRSLGVVMTSTGTAAGNAAGSQVEALTAGSPVLHITTQVDRAFMDRDRAAIHDVPRQPDMLKAISKSYIRVWEPAAAVDALIAAARAALTAPTGPVTLEIPVDVQRATASAPRVTTARCHVAPPAPDARAARCTGRGGAAVRAAADAVARRRRARRGGGGDRARRSRLRRRHHHERPRRGAGGPRGSLGAFNMTPQAQGIYDSADLMIVVGSRLRGNETRNNAHAPAAAAGPGRRGPDPGGAELSRRPVHRRATRRLVLEGLLARLPADFATDAELPARASRRRARSPRQALRAALGPYQRDRRRAAAPGSAPAAIPGCAT